MRRAVLLAATVLLILPACGADEPEVAVTTTEAADEATTTTAAGDDGPTTTAGQDSTSTTAGAPGEGPYIEDLEFHNLDVIAGTELTVSNRDDFAHTFSFEDESVSLSLGGGESDTFTAPAAGEYEIYCEIHGTMSGTLVVV